MRCLLAGKRGALWIGTSDGLARLKDGAVTTFTTANGLPETQFALCTKSGQSGFVSTENGAVGIEGSRRRTCE